MNLITQFAILVLFMTIGILGACAHYVKKRYADKTIDCSLWAYIQGNRPATLKAIYALFAAEFSLMPAHTEFNWQETGLAGLNNMKRLFLLPFIIAPAMVYAAPFVVSDPSTQTVTHCAYVIDANAQVDSVVETVPEGKRCKIDIGSSLAGVHTLKAKFVNIDPVWGRVESVFSPNFTYTKPGLLTAPGGLEIIP